MHTSDSITGAYLSQALEALRDSSCARRLYPNEVDPWHEGFLESAQRNLDASNARLRFLRTAVLFAALSAEALANEILATHLAEQDFKAADRMSPPDKLLLGPRLCGFEEVLRRGEEPHATLVDLFKVRNKLVHPKLGAVSGYVGLKGSNDKDDELYGPVQAVRFIRAVGRTGVALHDLRPRRHFRLPFQDIVIHGAVLDDYLERTSRQLQWIPSKDAEPEADLEIAMARRRKRKGEERHRAEQRREPDDAVER